MPQPVARHTNQGARAWSLGLLEWVRHEAPARCLDRGRSHDRCVAARKCSIRAVTCWALEWCVCVSCVLRLLPQPHLNVWRKCCIDKEQGVAQVSLDDLVPEQVTDSRNHHWSGKSKRLCDVLDQNT